MDTDAHLLFAALAVQLELIDSRQFAEAATIWAGDRARPLREILIERRWLTSDDCHLLDGLVQRKLAKHQGDARAALGETADLPVREALKDVPDDKIQQTMSVLGPARNFVQLETVVFRAPPGDAGARYTRTRVHDRGGMGQVWIARDNTLNRAVALKELRPDKRPTSTDYRRLSKEAQITGQLEHPNIVPVYELVGGAESTDGAAAESPAFYTMRLVRGQTFSSSIVEYHRRRKTGVPHPLEFQRLLRSFLAICHAVGYAHSRGVVHRDLKPGNVMLGSFGEVVVLDWGLAKVVGQPADSEQHSAPIEVTDSKLDEMSPGAPLGTLPYAAPEQVVGLHDSVDSRADIYGLGAILFCILTGVPPHRAETTEALKREKLALPAPPSIELNKDAPPALDAICRKAMAGAPKDRYATALQLADDVERWLADEPTSVYRESRTERAMRWLRKHRSRARAVVVSLVAISLVAVIASLVVDQARRGEAAARRNAELALLAKNAALEEKNAALDKANWRLTVSRRVADLMLIGVGDMLKYYPAGRHLQLRLLEESLRDYEQLSDSQKDDVEVRAEVRRVHARVIDVRLQLGRHEEAERDLIKLLADWPAPAESATDELGERTGVLVLRAELADRNGREDWSAVERMFREADAAASRLPSGHPTRIMLRLRRGQVHLRHQRVVAALADFAGASAELKTSGRADARATLTAALLEGQTLIAMGRSRDAAPLLAQAVAAAEEMSESFDDDPTVLELLGIGRIQWAQAMRQLGRAEEADVVFNQAVDDFDVLLESLAEPPRLIENRAAALVNAAAVRHQSGRNDSAAKLLKETISAISLVASRYRQPNDMPIEIWEVMTSANLMLGRTAADLGEREEAEASLRAAEDAYSNVLLVRAPTAGRYYRGLATTYRYQARLKSLAGDDAAAEKLLKAAFGAAGSAGNWPPTIDVREELAQIHGEFAQLCQRRDDDVEWRRNLSAAIELLAGESDDELRIQSVVLLLDSGTASDLARAERTLRALNADADASDVSLALLGRYQVETQRWDDAVATLSKIKTEDAPPNSPHEHWLAWAYFSRGREGDRALAVATLDKAKARIDEAAPGDPRLRTLTARVERMLKPE